MDLASAAQANLSIGYPIFAREVTAMPIKVLNAVETAAAEVLLESDMRFLMEDVGLRHDVSLVFAHFGFGRMRRFAGLEDTKDKVRAVLIADFGIDPAAGLQQRGDIADLLSCWDATRLQLEKENQLRAENRVNAIQTAASREPRASWNEIRKEAYEEVRSEGKTLNGAIQSVNRNQELRSSQFLTPFSFQQRTQRPSNHANSVPPPSGGSWERPPKKDKKGKDGKDGKGRDRWNINTPDGRVICKKWNTKNVGCEGGCGLVHHCQVCNQPSHQTHEHIAGFVTDKAKPVAAKRQKKGK
jgi:hypothetical protein